MARAKSDEREAREARDRLRRYNARQTVHALQKKRRIRDNIVALLGVLVVAAIATSAQVFYFTGGPGTPEPVPSASPTSTPDAGGTNVGDVPPASASEFREWTGTMTVNDIELGISLDGMNAPQAVAAFVTGASAGYFDGKTCHRLVRSASAGLLQCGSLDGTGATDTSFAFGPLENTPSDGMYPAGTLAMARVGGDGFSQGRQFFIVFEDAALPDDAAGGYTVFGTVTSGLDRLVAEIADAGIAGGAEDGAPVVPATIGSIALQ